MVWTTKPKDLGVGKTQAHRILQAGLVGRAPGITSLAFGPLELFGAMARCHYTHVINPHAVTWEVQHMASLLEQHVDDVSQPFEILPSADTMKDYVKSYFIGTVAAGIAYLAMIQDGYVWSDHWENLTGGAPAVTKSPDFVFGSPKQGTALMESKGTRSATATTFDTTVSDGYAKQIEPHLGHTIGGALATHGYSIGSHLVSPTRASLNIHHTATPASTTTGPEGGGAPSVVQRHSFATAFNLAHGPSLGEQVRGGRARQPFVFLRFQWGGRWWLSGFDPRSRLPMPRFSPDFHGEWFVSGPRPRQAFSFAIREDRAAAALRLFLSPARAADPPRFPAEAEELGFDRSIGRVEGKRGEGVEGIVFPDGLAVLGAADVGDVEVIYWDGPAGVFLPLVDAAWLDRF